MVQSVRVCSSCPLSSRLLLGPAGGRDERRGRRRLDQSEERSADDGGGGGGDVSPLWLCRRPPSYPHSALDWLCSATWTDSSSSAAATAAATATATAECYNVVMVSRTAGRFGNLFAPPPWPENTAAAAAARATCAARSTKLAARVILAAAAAAREGGRTNEPTQLRRRRRGLPRPCAITAVWRCQHQQLATLIGERRPDLATTPQRQYSQLVA